MPSARTAAEDHIAFDRYLRAGRRTAPLEVKFNQNHDPTTGRFTTADRDVHLSPESAAMAARISNGFFLRTGKGLVITSGTRTPEKQAEAMINKKPETWAPLYRDQAAVHELRGAYDKAMQAGEGRAGAISAMAAVIRRQEQDNRYISRHLQSHALDIRIRNLSSREIDLIKQEAQRQGGKVIREGGGEPHVHVQF